MVIRTDDDFPRVFRGEMPLLRSITTPVTNHHEFLITEHITRLALCPPYTLEALLATLKNTPLLETLELRGVYELAYEGPPRIPLPYLEHLLLYDCWYQVMDFISLPTHTRISISVPGHIDNGIPWESIDVISSLHIPPAFLRSSAVTIAANEVRRSTEVRFVGQMSGNRYHCWVHIDLEKGSGLRHRRGVCLYAMGMIRNLTSVTDLHLRAKVPFPQKLTMLFQRFRSLKVLVLSGPFVYPTLVDLASPENDFVPECLVLDRKALPLFRKFRDRLISQLDPGGKTPDSG